MLARLDGQIGVVTKALRNRLPWLATASMLGVRTIRLPVQPSVSLRWSSDRTNRMLGGRASLLTRPLHPATSAAAARPEDCRKRRRFNDMVVVTLGWECGADCVACASARQSRSHAALQKKAPPK